MDLSLIASTFAVLVSAATLIGFAVKAGERQGILKRLDKEVDILRGRMHDFANTFANIQLTLGQLSTEVKNLVTAVGRLEAKLERHTEAGDE